MPAQLFPGSAKFLWLPNKFRLNRILATSKRKWMAGIPCNLAFFPATFLAFLSEFLEIGPVESPEWQSDFSLIDKVMYGYPKKQCFRCHTPVRGA